MYGSIMGTLTEGQAFLARARLRAGQVWPDVVLRRAGGEGHQQHQQQSQHHDVRLGGLQAGLSCKFLLMGGMRVRGIRWGGIAPLARRYRRRPKCLPTHPMHARIHMNLL